jgi:hypothetical protein
MKKKKKISADWKETIRGDSGSKPSLNVRFKE